MFRTRPEIRVEGHQELAEMLQEPLGGVEPLGDPFDGLAVEVGE